MFEAADRIIVTSARLQTSTSALDEFARKCVVIPLPAATSSPSQDSPSLRQAARARFGVRPGTRVVLFVGRLVYYKGLHHLLATMARLNATLLIVGEGPLRSALERQARELKLGERIRFLGRLGDDELHQAYQVADVFVLPSTHVAEAFGMVQVEAMQNGCPVINTDLPTGVPSVSIHGETGLTIPPGNPEALELALRLLLEDEELRRRLGRAGVERSALFSRRAVAAKVVELYRSLLGADCSRDVAPPTLDC
jgi:rhamnosyl/mannosyltransferase